MPRRAHNHCIIREETTDGVWGDTGLPRPLYKTWCGQSSHVNVGMRQWANETDTCPRCSAAFFKDRSGGVTLEKLELPTEYAAPRVYGFGPYGTKSAYKIMRDGECYGLLSIPTGWGKTWEIHALEAPVNLRLIKDGGEPVVTKSDNPADRFQYDRDLDGKKREVGTPIYPGSNIRVRPPYKTRASAFRSKESALAEVSDMIADGFLLSETTVIAKAREDRAAVVQRQAELEEQRRQDEIRRQEKARETAEELEMIALAMAEMTTEGKISNYQREALFLAAKRLGIEWFS